MPTIKVMEGGSDAGCIDAEAYKEYYIDHLGKLRQDIFLETGIDIEKVDYHFVGDEYVEYVE